MTSNEILDTVLMFIYESIASPKLEQKIGSFYLESLFEEFKTAALNKYLNDEANNFMLDYVEFSEVIDKLNRDGYIKQEFYRDVPTPNYKTTFEGRWFIQQGGYVALSETLDAEKRKNDFDTLQSLRNGQRLNWLTLVLCLCTGGLVFYQIWHDTNPIWSVSLWTALFLFLSGILIGLCIWLILQQMIRHKANK